MRLLQRTFDLIKEDLAAIIPGSRVPFNRETFSRLLLYIGLAAFIIGLAFPPSGGMKIKKPSNPLDPFSAPKKEPDAGKPQNI